MDEGSEGGRGTRIACSALLRELSLRGRLPRALPPPVGRRQEGLIEALRGLGTRYRPPEGSEEVLGPRSGGRIPRFGGLECSIDSKHARARVKTN